MLKAAREALEHLGRGLAHAAQHAGADVFRGHLELAADVVGDEFAQKRPVLIREGVVKAHAGAHEHLFHPGNFAQGAEDVHIFAVAGVEVFAGLGEEALFALAGPAFKLALAGGLAEVGRGAADIVDVALEIARARQQFGLAEDGRLAARG